MPNLTDTIIHVIFNPRDWNWVVGGDTSRAWSSAAGSYVETYDSERVTYIDSEENLTEVLVQYGLPVPVAAKVLSVTPAQGQLALLQAGLLDTVEAWVASQSRAVQIEYKARTEWKRDWPLVIEAATALGLTEAQLDDLLALAATL